ncbi:MAG: FadR/GntR family transcriptional regulator [Polaromonas sp.]|uniref:FadR/GntR family transcriptional regulator n=1 Tax=Polaromonas sp. TaxID=1869339 RepID=UPI00271944FB|nr:FadR/GntR family transcriptional regulator [Polaromonas sp.]MDO9114315.1 FadR/GntR family transcriptional regulator [Polaromonas sp.]MDP1886599.1 FadR/GntR family transcriptional regulator [Polaromonas sp.]
MTTAVDSNQVLSRILPFIRERGYAAGDRIPSERELAERFKISRGILREALSALEAMRVIQRRPQSGIYLRDVATEASVDMLVLESDLGLPVSAADVKDLNEFRSMLEIQSVGLACSRRTDADLARIDAILKTSRERHAAGQSISDQDAAFHMALCAASGNKLIQRAANSFWLASKTRRAQYFGDPANGLRSIRQHTALRDAVAAGDATRALAVLGDHLGNVERYWMLHLAPTDKASPATTA